MGMWEKKSDPNRYASKFGGMSAAEKAVENKRYADAINQSLASGSDLKKRAKLKGKFLATGGTEADYDAILSAYSAQQSGGGDTALASPQDDNPYTGLGPTEVNQQVPSWMHKPDNKWDALNQAMIADWVQQGMQAENRKHAQGILGEGLEDIDTRLVDTPVMGEGDIDRIMAGHEARLGIDEAREIDAIKQDMAQRGLTYDSAMGAGLTTNAMLRRQMAAAGARSGLETEALFRNRDALERGLQFREGVRSNIANIGTGFGSTPFTMPNPMDVWQMKHPELFGIQRPSGNFFDKYGGAVDAGLGILKSGAQLAMGGG